MLTTIFVKEIPYHWIHIPKYGIRAIIISSPRLPFQLFLLFFLLITFSVTITQSHLISQKVLSAANYPSFFLPVQKLPHLQESFSNVTSSKSFPYSQVIFPFWGEVPIYNTYILPKYVLINYLCAFYLSL